MKTSELTKLLKKSGSYFVSHGANHDTWYSPITDNYFLVPRHPSEELKTGTARKIMKDAGIDK